MEIAIVFAAVAGLLAGAGGALWVSSNAPRMLGKVLIFAVIAVFALPIAVSMGAKDEIIDSVVRGGMSGMQSRGMMTAFLLAAPLGAICIGISSSAQRRLTALALMGLIGLPVYLMLTGSLTAAALFAV